MESDYSKLDLEDLYDVLDHVDRERYPQRYQAVLKEIHKRENEKQQSRSKEYPPFKRQAPVGIYWAGFFTAMIIILILKKTLKIPDDDFIYMYLFRIYYLIYFIVFVITNIMENKKLTEYLKINHRETWLDLTTSDFWGQGMKPGQLLDQKKFRRFIYSDDDLSDNNVLFLKQTARRRMGFYIASFLIPAFLFPLLKLW